MVKSKFRLADAATYHKVKEWFDSGRGVFMWTNKDLSNCSRPEMITPGDDAGAPHWAYVGTPEVLTPEDIEVCIESRIALPPEWFPKCKYCTDGYRTVTEIAEIQKRSHAEAKEFLNGPGGAEWIDEERFKCNSCGGSGHTVEAPMFRVKRLPPYRGGGFEVSKSGQQKCIKLAAKLAEHYRLGDRVLWDWQHEEYGMTRAYFYTEVVTPFTEFTE